MHEKRSGAALCLLCCVGTVGVGLFSLPTAAVYFGSTTYWLYILLGGALATAVTVLFSVSLEGSVCETCGKYFPRCGKVLCFVYVLFYIVICGFLLAYYAHTVQRWFLDGVPRLFLLLFLGAVCLYTATKPQRDVGRICCFVGFLVLLVIPVMRIVMLLSGDARNLMPVFESAQIKSLPGGAVFISGFFVLLGLLGVWKVPGRTRVGAGCIAILGATIVFLLATAGCVSVLGSVQTARYLESSVLAMKNLNLSKLDFLQRGDIVFIVTWSFLILLSGTLSCHIPYHTMRELFDGKECKWLFWLFYIMLVGIGAWIPSEETALLCLVYTATGGGIAALVALPVGLLWRKRRTKR